MADAAWAPMNIQVPAWAFRNGDPAKRIIGQNPITSNFDFWFLAETEYVTFGRVRRHRGFHGEEDCRPVKFKIDPNADFLHGPPGSETGEEGPQPLRVVLEFPGKDIDFLFDPTGDSKGRGTVGGPLSMWVRRDGGIMLVGELPDRMVMGLTGLG